MATSKYRVRVVLESLEESETFEPMWQEVDVVDAPTLTAEYENAHDINGGLDPALRLLGHLAEAMEQGQALEQVR